MQLKCIPLDRGGACRNTVGRAESPSLHRARFSLKIEHFTFSLCPPYLLLRALETSDSFQLIEMNFLLMEGGYG